MSLPIISALHARLLAAAGADARPYPGFLGRGWSFPPGFSPVAASVDMAAGDADIRQSIWTILSTRPGERIMLATFGCDLQSMVFTSLTPTSAAEIGKIVTTAIINWEPRITVENTSVTETEMAGWISISVDYVVRQTNSRSNLVYPFCLSEASLPMPVP